MDAWLILIIPSALVGFLSALYIRKSWAIYVAGAVPWFGLLAALLYTVYFIPDKSSDASMWPIAQFFGGTIAAFIGVLAFVGTNKFIKHKSDTD